MNLKLQSVKPHFRRSCLHRQVDYVVKLVAMEVCCCYSCYCCCFCLSNPITILGRASNVVQKNFVDRSG